MYKSHTKDPVAKYIVNNSLRLNDVQKSLINETMKLSYAVMLGSADSLQLLANMCKMIRAKKTLDIGMFTGYSALTIAQVLPPDGRVVTCDVSNQHEALAREHWRRAGVESRIDFRVGPAVNSLRRLLSDNAGEAGSYDFAFIDADKEGYADYYELCLRLVRPGGFIAFDNVLWGGAVLNEADQSSSTTALRQICQKLHADERVDVSILNSGDGVALAFVK
uniref:Caffeoyl-CoA O-methyltransferase n=2 Tax=Macrostomum lignano TaxID=282301 RepID=A0A1I8GHX8_9PLAT